MVRVLNTKSGTEITMSETSWALCKVGSPHLKLIEDAEGEDMIVTANIITVTEVKAPPANETVKAELQKPEPPKQKPKAQNNKRNHKATTKKKEVKNDSGK